MMMNKVVLILKLLLLIVLLLEMANVIDTALINLQKSKLASCKDKI